MVFNHFNNQSISRDSLVASAVLAANLELFREQLLDPHVGNSQPLQSLS